MSVVTDNRIKEMLEKSGAIVDGHFVLKNRGKKDNLAEIPGSGDHSGLYVNKDAVFPFAEKTQWLGAEIAERFWMLDIDVQVVAAPAIGAIGLEVYVRDALFERLVHGVFAVYAEDDPDGGKIFKRGFDKFISGKRVLVVEDITTTGGSVKQVIDAVQVLGGDVVGAAVIVNRGGITAEDIGAPRLESLMTLSSEQTKKWLLEECPLCKEGVPVNMDLGKGRLFLKNKADLPVSQE